MDENRSRIALFVDYEDVCSALKGEDQNYPRPADILRPLLDEFTPHGDIVYRFAYAEWAKMPPDTVVLIESLGFTPVYLLNNAHYKRPTAEFNVINSIPVGIALDALNLCITNTTIDMFVFVAADREYFEVIDRIRQNDAKVILAAFERSISEEVAEIAGVETVYLENILGTPKSVAPSAERRVDWAPFIRLLLSLELRYGYVGYRGLKEKLDASVGCGGSENEKRHFMDMATQQEIITLEKMNNPKNPEFPLTVCRLNRRHPIVQSILRNSLKLE